MKLLEVLSEYKNICWYPGSYFDFANPARLSVEYVKNNDIDYSATHDLFVFTDCCLNSEYLDWLNKVVSFVVSFPCDAKVKNIKAIDKIKIPFNVEIHDNDKTEYINKSWLFDAEVSVDGGTYTIKVLYVVADAYAFLESILKENKIKITTMIVEPGFDSIGAIINHAYNMVKNNNLKYLCANWLPNSFNYDCADKDFIFHNKIHNIDSLNSLNVYVYDEDVQHKKYRRDRMFEPNLAVFINNRTYLIDFGAPVSVFKSDAYYCFGEFVVIDDKKYPSNEDAPFALEDAEYCANKRTTNIYGYPIGRPNEFGGIIGLDILMKTGLTVMDNIVMFKPYDFKSIAPEYTINLESIKSDRTGETFCKLNNIRFENGKTGNYILDGGYYYCQTKLFDLSDRRTCLGKDCNLYKDESLEGKVGNINAKCGDYKFACETMEYRAKNKYTAGILSGLSKMNIDGLMPARFFWWGKRVSSFDFKNNTIAICQ